MDAVVREGRVHITDDFYETKAARSAKKWGDGCALKIRIEPEREWYLASSDEVVPFIQSHIDYRDEYALLGLS